MMSAALERWTALTPRERALVGVAGVLVAVFVLVFGLLMPGWAQARSAEDRNRQAAVDLVNVKTLAAQVEARRAAAAGITADQFRPLIEAAAAETMVTLTTFETVEGGTDIAVLAQRSSEVVAFARLASARTATGISSMSIERAATGITGRIVLARSAS